ncbi:hypothetical protein LVB87_04880 [Lysobacter sp. KIS68-7]|uniref:hypothetical protein n=1 Tax=Lysobacter sp. KIS68-7 TaxID=2904252 RepID=UPI001E49B252|nr:hypothetical protein [Lysobacter sp. KIS68-7]UHQ20495.1 hypothetical protein LVB87_04880 [Lysobacter sp. KIS68-7]
MNDAAPDLQLLGALALELAPGTGAARDALDQDGAGALAARMAHDLAGFAAEASALQLVTVGAHYDVVELLRPGWPLHRELDQLAARAPGDAGGRIIAFGAHDGTLPGALTPQTEYAGGPLRLVPFVLGGDAEVASRVGDAFERDLMERGMAGAATALLAQEAFGLRVEHARYLTLHDLAAMMALQYEHAGLAPLWPVLEAAMLEPDAEEWLEQGPEPIVHYTDREARIALFTPQAWRERYHPESAHDSVRDCARLERAFEMYQARQRQFSALLMAHGVPVTFVHCDTDMDSHAQLA